MKIISFFSFKGGVGRTALLVNLATYWATRGRVVVIVDMDLAAPGVSYSPLLETSPLEDDRPPCGVHELLAAYYAGKKAGDPYSFGFFPASHCFRRMKPPDSLGHAWPLGGAVLVLPAGEAGIELPTRLGKDSPHYYPPKTGRVGENPDEMSLRAFAKLFRQDLENYRLPTAGSPRPIDLVLIDCRTGWPELLDLSLGYLADHMVLVSGFNQQNQQGLRHTLHALRKGQAAPRIPFGKYSSTLTVAFSHIPVHIHEDQASLEALRKSEKILEEFRLPPPLATQQPEALPPVYHLPYTPRLVSSDLPLFPSQDRNHPYIRVLLTIADQLEQTGVLAEELLQIEKELIRVGGKPLPVQEHTAATGTLDVAVPSGGSLDELLQLPKWYWPWIGSNENPQSAGWQKIAEFIPADEKPDELLDTFLDGLCFAISLEPDEKKNILQQYPSLSTWQRQEMLTIFHTERQKVAALQDSYKHEVFEILFKRQKEWAILLRGEEEGIQQFLKPLGGNLHSGSETVLFPTWNNFPLYQKLLKEECDRNINSCVNHKNDACVLPEQHTPNLPVENFRHILVDNPLKYGLNKREKILPIIFEKDINVWHTMAHFAINPLNYGRDDEENYRIMSSMSQEQPEFWSSFGDQLKEKSNKIEEAEAAYRHSIELNQQDSNTWHKLGVLLFHSSRYSEAEDAFQQAIDIHYSQQAIDIHHSQQVIDINHSFAKAWNGLGVCLTSRGAYEKAENAYRKAIQIDERFAHAWMNLGNLLQHELNRYEEAENAFMQATKIDERYVNAWYSLGNLLQYQLKRYEEAEKAYKQAIKIDKNFRRAWSHLGDLYHYRFNRCEEAESAYKQVINIENNYDYSWIKLINFYSDMHRYREAEITCRQAIDLAREKDQLWNTLAVLFFYRYNYKQCFECLNNGIIINDSNSFLSMNRGHLSLILGKPWRNDLEKAREQFSKSLDEDDVLYYLRLSIELSWDVSDNNQQIFARSPDNNIDEYIGCYIETIKNIANAEDWRSSLEYLLSGMQSHGDRLDALEFFYYLAGTRPDLREIAREAAGMVFHMSADRIGQWKDRYDPQRIECFRPFVEGRSYGAGDPQDVRLFFHDIDSLDPDAEATPEP